MRRAILALTLAGVASVAAAGPAPAAQTGVSMALGEAVDPNVQDRLHAVGAKWLRFFMVWPAAEPERGHFDEQLLAAARHAGRLARDRGMKLQVVFTQAPSWASGEASPIAPPRDPEDYANAIGHWARELRGLVDVWEVWNEPDERDFWLPGPQPERYVALLKASYRSIKRADPGARVGLGPMTANNFHWLEQLYAHGAKGHFDTVSVHTDTGCLLAPPEQYGRDRDGRISRWSFLGFRTVHDVMAANGDGSKPILMTEFGWNSSRTTCDRGVWKGMKASGVSERQQAENLLMALHCLADSPYVEAALWFNYADTTSEDTHNGRYGLLRHDGSPKPAWEAFADVSRNGDRMTRPCGDFAAPAITLRRTRRHVEIRVSDPSGVRALRVWGRSVRPRSVSRRAAPASLTLRVATRGSVVVQAADRNGNRTIERIG